LIRCFGFSAVEPTGRLKNGSAKRRGRKKRRRKVAEETERQAREGFVTHTGKVDDEAARQRKKTEREAEGA